MLIPGPGNFANVIECLGMGRGSWIIQIPASSQEPHGWGGGEPEKETCEGSEVGAMPLLPGH